MLPVVCGLCFDSSSFVFLHVLWFFWRILRTLNKVMIGLV